MKKFLFKIGYLAIPLILVGIILDYGISCGLKQTSDSLGEYEVWNAIYESAIDSDIAIYGSSRAWVQFDPVVLEQHLGKKVYNFGIDGHNFRLQYLRHLEYIQHNTKPQHIILSVDVFTLQQRQDLYLQDQFLPYMLWNTNIISYTSPYNGFTKVDYYVPFVRYGYRSHTIAPAINDLLNTSSDTSAYRLKGYKGFNRVWDTQVDSLLASKEKYEIEFDINTSILLERFIKECKNNHIALTLVYPPEHIKGQLFVSNRHEAIYIFEALAKKYNIPFLNYSDDELCYKKEFFYNASHLNKRGSQLFTEKLAKDLKVNDKKRANQTISPYGTRDGT